MPKLQRIYVVMDMKSAARWLVRAINPAVAVHRVTAVRFAARVASQEELVRLTTQGLEVLQGGRSGDREDPDPVDTGMAREMPAEDLAALP